MRGKESKQARHKSRVGSTFTDVDSTGKTTGKDKRGKARTLVQTVEIEDMYGDDYDSDYGGSIFGMLLEGIKTAQLSFYDKALSIASFVDSIVLNSIEAVEGSSSANDDELMHRDRTYGTYWFPFLFKRFCYGSNCRSLLAPVIIFFITLSVLSLATFFYLKRKHEISTKHIAVYKSQIAQSRLPSFSPLKRAPISLMSEGQQTVNTCSAEKENDAKLTSTKTQQGTTYHAVETDMREKRSRAKLSRNVSFCKNVDTSLFVAENSSRSTTSKKRKIASRGKRIQTVIPTDSQANVSINVQNKGTTARTNQKAPRQLSTPPKKTRSNGCPIPSWSPKNSSPGRSSWSKCSTAEITGSLNSYTQTAQRPRPSRPSRPQPKSRDRSFTRRSASAVLLSDSSRATLEKTPLVFDKSQGSVGSISDRQLIAKRAEVQGETSKPRKSKKLTIKSRETEIKRKSKQQTSSTGAIASTAPNQSLIAKGYSTKTSRTRAHDRISHEKVGEMRKPFTLDMKTIREPPGDSMVKSKNEHFSTRRATRKYFTNSKTNAKDSLYTTTSSNVQYPSNDSNTISAMFTSPSGEQSWSSRLIKPVATKEHSRGCPEACRIRKTDTPQLMSLTGEGAFMSYSKSWSIDLPEACNVTKDQNLNQTNGANTSGKISRKKSVFQIAHTNVAQPAELVEPDAHVMDTSLLANHNVNSWLGLWSEQGNADVDLVNSLTGKNACIRPKSLTKKCRNSTSQHKTRDNHDPYPRGPRLCSREERVQKDTEFEFTSAKSKSGRINLHPWPSVPKSKTYQQQANRHYIKKEKGGDPSICKGQHYISNHEASNLKSNHKHVICKMFPESVDQSHAGAPWNVTHNETFLLCDSDSDTLSNRQFCRKKKNDEREHVITSDENDPSAYKYVYVLKDGLRTYKSRKGDLKSKLRRRIQPYRIQPRLKNLPKHQTRPSTGKQGHTGRLRGSELSEDDVIHVLENGLVKPSKLLTTKSVKDLKKPSCRGNRCTPYPEQDSDLLHNMLQELQNLTKDQEMPDRKRHDFCSKCSRKNRIEQDRRSSYCASDEDSSLKNKPRNKARKLPNFQRCYTKSKRFRPHRQKPYGVEVDCTSSSGKTNSFKRLNKNNCSPSKGRRFVLMPQKERKPGIQTDFPLHMREGQNPGYDSRLLVTSGATLPGDVLYSDPYGQQPVSKTTPVERASLTRFLFPASDKSVLKQKNEAVRKGNRFPSFWEPLGSDSLDSVSSQISHMEQRMWLRQARRQQKARLPFDFKLSALVKDGSAKSPIDAENQSYTECQIGASDSNTGKKNVNPKSVFQSTQTDPLESIFNGMNLTANANINVVKVDNSSQVVPSSLKSIGIQTSPIENVSLFEVKSPKKFLSRGKVVYYKAHRPIRARHSMRRPKLRSRCQMSSSAKSSDSFRITKPPIPKEAHTELYNRVKFHERQLEMQDECHKSTQDKQTVLIDRGATHRGQHRTLNEEGASNNFKDINQFKNLLKDIPATCFSKSRNVHTTNNTECWDTSPKLKERDRDRSKVKEQIHKDEMPPQEALLSEESEQLDSAFLDKTYSIRKSSSVLRNESQVMPESARFNTCPRKSSGIKDKFLLRPKWKNADVNELDKRVKRALRLREELQLSKQNKHNRKSTFFTAGEQLGSPISNDSVNTEDLRPSDTDEVPSCQLDMTFGLDQTDDVISNRKDRSLTPTDASTVLRDPHGVYDFHCSKQTAEHTASASRHTHAVCTDSVDLRVTEENSPERYENCDESQQYHTNPQNEGACGGIDRTFSLHDTTSQPVHRNPEHTAGTCNYSIRNDSNNSDGHERNTCERVKNTPPTKISKVDNVVPSGNAKLVGELVQTLPQVPMLSFIEWFVETSDPRNYMETSVTVPSTSSENCTQQQPSTSKTFIGCQQSSNAMEHKSILKDTPIIHTALKKTTLTELKNASASLYPTGMICHDLVKNSHVQNSNNTEAKRSIIFAPETQTINKERDTSSCNWQKECAAENEKGKKSPKLKVRKIRDMMKSPLDNVVTACANIKQVKFPIGGKSSFNSSCGKSAKNSFHKHAFEYANFGKDNESDGHLSEDEEVSTANTMLKSGAGTARCQTDHTDQSVLSNSVATELNGTDVYCSGLTKALADIASNETKTHAEIDLTKSGNTQRYPGSRGSSPRRNRYSPDFQFCSGSPYMFQMPDGEDDIEPGEKCAPGIRQILMKLRNNKDTEETTVVNQPEKMRITLKKSSDVTGIIAKFQGSSHRK